MFVGPPGDGRLFVFVFGGGWPPFAGAGARITSSPPVSAGSSEDSLRPPAQLRPAFAPRRKTITGNHNSGERPVHRRTQRHHPISGGDPLCRRNALVFRYS